MDVEKIRQMLKDVKENKIEIEDALATLKKMPFEDIGFAKIDHHRELRNGYPEVVYCEGKTKEHVLQIVLKMMENGDSNILATRANEELYRYLKSKVERITYYDKARIILIGEKKPDISDKIVLVLSAGTSDFRVSEEAAVTAEFFGNRVERIYDVGVAGIHRLFSHIDKIITANVLIVVAGMEGALPSVVAGMVDKPVIAVPTSVGYGANFNGLSALLTMINSCASGIGVVNIDNGFGAGYLASMINNM